MGSGCDNYDGRDTAETEPRKRRAANSDQNSPPKPGDPKDGVADGGVVPGEETGFPEAPEIPDPMSRRMPTTY